MLYRPSLPRSVWPFVLLLVLWKIWDARNEMTFRGNVQTPFDVIRVVISFFREYS